MTPEIGSDNIQRRRKALGGASVLGSLWPRRVSGSEACDAADDLGFSMHMTDAELVAAAVAGDRDAAGILLGRYYPDCCRFAYRMLGHPHDADDVVQDTFFRVLRALGSYREQDRFRSWLFRILANSCRKALFQRRRRLRWFASDNHRDRLAELAVPNDPPPDEASEQARLAVLSDALQSAVLRLDAKQREAFLLKYGEGMEYTEMAAITGVGVSALKMRVKRACEALRPLLREVTRDF